MSSRRGADHATPSEAVLRRLASTTALDVARAPVAGQQHVRLERLLREQVALDGALAATADAIRRSATHADTLRREARRWDELEARPPELRDALDDAVGRVDPARRMPSHHDRYPRERAVDVLGAGAAGFGDDRADLSRHGDGKSTTGPTTDGDSKVDVHSTEAGEGNVSPASSGVPDASSTRRG